MFRSLIAASTRANFPHKILSVVGGIIINRVYTISNLCTHLCSSNVEYFYRNIFRSSLPFFFFSLLEFPAVPVPVFINSSSNISMYKFSLEEFSLIKLLARDKLKIRCSPSFEKEDSEIQMSDDVDLPRKRIYSPFEETIRFHALFLFRTAIFHLACSCYRELYIGYV